MPVTALLKKYLLPALAYFKEEGSVNPDRESGDRTNAAPSEPRKEIQNSQAKPVAAQSNSVRNNNHGQNGEADNCPTGSDCDL